jgi:hypothetical protein
MECPRGVPNIPNVLQIRGATREIKVWIWGSWQAGCYSSRAAQAWPVRPVLVTGLTGASPLWDCLRWTVGFLCLWAELLLVCFWKVSRSLARLCVEFSSIGVQVLELVFVPGPREVTESSWNFVVHLLFVTGLTGQLHRSDQCHRSDRCGTDSRLCSFPLRLCGVWFSCY